MLNLIRLELQKHKLQRLIITVIVAILFIMLFMTISLVDNSTKAKDNYESTFRAISMLISIIFMLFSSVLTSTLIINEYNNKTILILFSYPINKHKLIITKLLMVFLFTIVTMTISHICCSFYVITLDHYFDIIQGVFHMSYLKSYFVEALISIISCGVLSLFPFIAGMFKKSVPFTMLSALFIWFLRLLIITKNQSYHETIPQLLIIIILVLTGVVYTMQTKVLKLD